MVSGEPEEKAAVSSETKPSGSKRWLRVETALAVAGVLIAVGFFLAWFESVPNAGHASGLTLAKVGGVWSALFAAPALGALTAVLGLLGSRASRHAALATVVAALALASIALASRWPWIYLIGIVAGLAIVGLGLLKRGLQASPLIGLALIAALAIGAWLFQGFPLVPSEQGGDLFGLAVPVAIPLLTLAAFCALAGLGLVVAGLRKKGCERSLVIAGAAVVGLSAFVAALDGYGVELATSGLGAWMTGTAILLMSILVLTTAAKKTTGESKVSTRTASEKVEIKTSENAVDAEKKAAPVADKKAAAKANKAKADKADAAKAEKPATSEKQAGAGDAKAASEKKAKLERLKKLKAEELAEAKVAKAAEADEKATAAAGEALANEPEPTFAVDPSAPPPPKNEDREALMRRVGVKKPPPPSESELEAMLAALKSRTDDD